MTGTVLQICISTEIKGVKEEIGRGCGGGERDLEKAICWGCGSGRIRMEMGRLKLEIRRRN